MSLSHSQSIPKPFENFAPYKISQIHWKICNETKILIITFKIIEYFEIWLSSRDYSHIKFFYKFSTTVNKPPSHLNSFQFCSINFYIFFIFGPTKCKCKFWFIPWLDGSENIDWLMHKLMNNYIGQIITYPSIIILKCIILSLKIENIFSGERWYGQYKNFQQIHWPINILD